MQKCAKISAGIGPHPVASIAMCARYTLYHSPQEVAARFGAVALAPMRARYNIAPTQGVLTVLEDHGRQLAEFRWGLVPSWAKDTKIGSRMINARAETLAEKPSFRTALTRRRCLIPADGFYEWREADNPKEGGKTPLYFHRKDSALFSFAGLWDEWISPDGSPLRSCTIITGPPNPLIAPIHDRMPIILHEEDESAWLDPEIRDPNVLTHFLAPHPAELMESYEVSKQVNKPTVDEPRNIEAVGKAED